MARWQVRIALIGTFLLGTACGAAGRYRAFARDRDGVLHDLVMQTAGHTELARLLSRTRP